MARYLIPSEAGAARNHENMAIVAPDNVRRIARLGLSARKLRRMAREESKHVAWLRDHGLDFQADHCAARVTAMMLAAEECS